MAEYTDGKWTVHTGMKITGQAGLTYVADCYPFNERMNRPRLFEAKANAELICALQNAAIKLNPENPLAVAEGMRDLYEACKMLIEHMTLPKGELGRPYLADVKRKALKALASIERGK